MFGIGKFVLILDGDANLGIVTVVRQKIEMKTFCFERQV
jgi:hypothetical protein